MKQWHKHEEPMYYQQKKKKGAVCMVWNYAAIVAQQRQVPTDLVISIVCHAVALGALGSKKNVSQGASPLVG